jgi:HEAT repeat protein
VNPHSILAATISFSFLFTASAYSQSRPGELTAQIQALSRQDPKTATPELLKIYSSIGEDYHRGDILDVLGRLWATPRDRMNYRHPLPRTNPIPPEVKSAVLEGLKSTNNQIMWGASRAASMMTIDEAIPHLEKLGRSGQAILAAESLRNFDNLEAGQAVARLLQGSYADASAYGHLMSALPQQSFPEAIPILTSLLDNKHDTRFNGLRVCDWAADSLSRYLPAGPGFSKPRFWPENENETDRLMDFLVDAWKAYLRYVALPNPGNKQELAKGLYDLANEWNDGTLSINPPSGIRWARQMESLGISKGAYTDEQARSLKIKLTAQEIQLFTKLVGFDIKRKGTPPETPWTPSRFLASERNRFDASNHLLDLWNHPYVYVATPSHGAQFAIYSMGPNGIDNSGEGDDIASWELKSDPQTSVMATSTAGPKTMRRINITPQSPIEDLVNALQKGDSNDRLTVLQLTRGCTEKNPDIKAGIVAALSDPNPAVRGRAAGCCPFQFLRADSPNVVPTLIGMLHDKEPAARAGAMNALNAFYWLDQTDDAVNALRDVDSSVRLQGAMYFSNHPSKKAVAPLITALKDPDPQVRKWAAQGLGLTRDPEGLEPLRVLLNDPDEHVREFAKNGMRWIESRQQGH